MKWAFMLGVLYVSVAVRAADCPEVFPLKSADGNCYSCYDDRFNIRVLTPGDCTVCENRALGKYYIDTISVGLGCHKKCPDEAPMLNSKMDGCYGCDISVVAVSQNECTKCLNREFDKGRCWFKNESQEATVWRYLAQTGKCLDWCEEELIVGECDDLSSHVSRPKDCEACSNRIMVGKYCALKKCPDNTIRSKIGGCWSCNDEIIKHLGTSKTFPSNPENTPEFSKEECQKCPDLIYKNGVCITRSKR